MYVHTGQIVRVGERIPAVWEDVTLITFKHSLLMINIETFLYGVSWNRVQYHFLQLAVYYLFAIT